MNQVEELSDLLELQGVDLQIDRLLHQRETLPELAALEAARAAQAGLSLRLAEMEAELRSMRLDRDKAEGELAILEEKLGFHEKRLYAGGMSARETENMRREVEALRLQKGRLEERVLEALEREEGLEGPTASTRTALGEASGRAEVFGAQVTVRWKEIDAEVGSKEARKADITRGISADLLELYEKLRRTKEGVAVGRLVASVCGGCHLALSPTERAEALEASPPRCIHCRRILVP